MLRTFSPEAFLWLVQAPISGRRKNQISEGFSMIVASCSSKKLARPNIQPNRDFW
jgi:hypothetical protein